MSFGLYVGGFVIFVAGVAWGMSAMGMSAQTIGIVSVCLVGLGIMSGVAKERSKDPPK